MTIDDPFDAESHEIDRVLRLLRPFWKAVEAMQLEYPFATDAVFLSALFEIPDSVLARIALDRTGDLTTLRLAIRDVLVGTRVPGTSGGLSEVAKSVVEAMERERRTRNDVQRQEYVLLALLRAGGPQVRALMATFGVDRERVLRELPPEVRVVSAAATGPRAAAHGDSGDRARAMPPALVHGPVIRLMDFVYEGIRRGHAPSAEHILVELTQLPYSPVDRIAAERGFRSEVVRERVTAAVRVAQRDDRRQEHDWSVEANEIMATAIGFWRGRGELTLDHFLLALLEVGGVRVIELLASLEVTADRVRDGMPRLGADM